MRNALFIATLVMSSTASAMLPDNGWYWNPNESGRGFNIEIQNNVLFMSGFVYDQAGNQVWAVSGGTMSSDRFYSGTAYVTSGGQCVGCAYRAPTNTAIGNITVNFSDEQHATITFNGTAIQVQREPFGLDFTNPVTPLFGEWATTEGSVSFPVYFGERLSFTRPFTGNSGTPVAAGNRTGDTARVLVGNYTPGVGWGMLLDSAPSYYKVYVFTFTGFNRMQGISSTFLKTSQPSGYLDMLGSRVQSGVAAAGGNAPGVAVKNALSGAELDELNAAEAAHQTKAAPAELIEVAKRLRDAIR